MYCRLELWKMERILMKFDTKSGYGFMHLYLTLHPKKSPAYDPTEEGYIFDEAESRLHHFAEFIRFNEKLAAVDMKTDILQNFVTADFDGQPVDPQTAGIAAVSAMDHLSHSNASFTVSMLWYMASK